MKNVLVTGGCGFVGRNIVKRLLKEDCEITVLDSGPLSEKPATWPEFPPLVFSGADCRLFFRHMAQCRFDIIFHCAAIIGGRLKIDGDPLGVATDLSIDADFFNWLARVPVKPERVVYFSSSAVYPIKYQQKRSAVPLYESLVDFSEELLGKPDMTYGWSKLSGEYLAKFAVEKYGVPVVIYRPFSGYGPGQSFDYPFPSIVQHVMNCIIENNTLREKVPVTVWGSGDQCRDFIYIDDVVDAVFATMHKMAPGDVLNLGTGIATSFRELAHRTAAVLDRTIGVVNDASKPEGVYYRVADVTKLSQYFQPKVSLNEGIRRVYQHLTVGTE